MLRSSAVTVDAPGFEATPVESRLARGPIAAHQLPASAELPLQGVFAIAHTVSASETSALVPHANNVVILGWIDAMASLHGAWAGASREELAPTNRMWFVARHEVDYLGEAFAGDQLVLATWVETLGRTSLVRATRILRADGTILTRARSRWALVDLTTRRPTSIPAPVRERLASAAP